jgi:hypothetical protein
MVDCFDRIAVHMTELALEPVRQLARLQMLGEVSLRTPSNGRRYLLTIAKRFPDGEQDPARYVWSVVEIALDGEPLPDGQRAASADGVSLPDPESAYWAAVDGLCAVQQPG